MNAANFWRWTCGILILLMLTVVPFVYYRHAYTHGKRLRPVEEGKLYRSGCLTVEGFRDAIERYHIRTIINLRDEAPDPVLNQNWFDRWHTIHESELCKQFGVKFVYIGLDTVDPNKAGEVQPQAVAQYLKVLDDPGSYPILLHCQAGLHRTGMFAAIYRMEFDGWTNGQAYDEMLAHGFGVYNSTSANEYVNQYVLKYHPRSHADTGSTPAAALDPPSH